MQLSKTLLNRRNQNGDLLSGNPLNKRKILMTILWLALTGAMAVLIVFVMLDLWHYDFNVPYDYQPDDHFFTAASFKRLISGEYLFSEHLGAPYGSEYFYFPTYGEAGIYILTLIIAKFGVNYGQMINILYILSYVLAAVIGCAVLNNLGVKRLLSSIGGIIYAFIPYHELRGTEHLSLGFYCFAPVFIYIAYRLLTDETYFTYGKGFFKNKANRLTVIVLPLISLFGIYYSYFGCAVMLTAIFACWLSDTKQWKTALFRLTAIVEVCVALAIAAIPWAVKAMNATTNARKTVRPMKEAEFFGLKIIQLIMPLRATGFDWLSKKITVFNKTQYLANEGTEYLGIVGIIGLGIMLMIFLRNGVIAGRKRQINALKSEGFSSLTLNEKLTAMSMLVLVMILIGTIGGIGNVISVFITGMIRCYNRISIFIAFPCVFAFFSFCNYILEKMKSVRVKALLLAMILLFCAFSVRESNAFIKSEKCDDFVAEYYSDEAFVQRIEATVGDDAMIFQLPYQRFIESTPIYNMPDYASVRGYLHSDTLRWSYGGYRGCTTDRMINRMMKESTPEMLNDIVANGYDGIYVDRRGYSKGGFRSICRSIEDNLDVTATFVSDDGYLVFYAISPVVN